MLLLTYNDIRYQTFDIYSRSVDQAESLQHVIRSKVKNIDKQTNKEPMSKRNLQVADGSPTGLSCSSKKDEKVSVVLDFHSEEVC